MPRFATALAALVLLAFAPAPLPAQTVTGTVIERGSERPLPGVLVTLVDTAGREHARTLTNASGRFRLEAPRPGKWRVRAERIGYRTTHSEWLTLSAGEAAHLTLAASTQPIALEGLTVTGTSRCHIGPAEGRATRRLWQAASTALRAAKLTEEGGALHGHVLRYEAIRYFRQLTLPELRVRKEERWNRSGRYRGEPYESLPAERLAAGGYIQPDGDGHYNFYAPDAEVLLSSAFKRTHCFGVRRGSGERAGLIGLTFRPTPTREDAYGIRGTLWLDASTAKLEYLEFNYIDLPWPVHSKHVGGRVEFSRLPTGEWIVSEWRIRMPVLGSVFQGWREPGERRRVVVARIREVGGVVRAARTERRVFRFTEPATLTGVVWDSTRAAPLVGAKVWLRGTAYSTQTGPDGRFRLEELPAGRYTAAFSHPRLDSLGVVRLAGAEVALEAGEVSRARLAVPALTTLLAAACPDRAVDGDESTGTPTGAVVGVVRAAGTGVPVPHARVRLRWTGSDRTVRTDESGRFRVCGVPAGERVTARVAFLGRTGEEVAVRVPAGGVATPELTIEARSPGTITGRVVAAGSGEPVAGAYVRFPEAGRAATTDSEGRFRLEGLPAGTQPLVVKHIAYGTRRDTVRVRAGETVRLEAALRSEAIPLEGITVTVEEELSELELARRSSGTRMDLITRAEIKNYPGPHGHLRYLLMDEIPSINITRHPRHPFKWCIVPRAGRVVLVGAAARVGCIAPVVVLDGARIYDNAATLLNGLSLHQIESIQYLGPIKAGLRFGSRGAYGALIIYTRGSGPWAKGRP